MKQKVIMGPRRTSSFSVVRVSESEFCTYIAGSRAKTVYPGFPRSFEVFLSQFDCLA